MADTKALQGVEVKDAGEVQAVFSTFNVIDSDGDVTLPGAFTDGQQVRISSYGHGSWQGSLPVGRGVIRQTAGEAILEGQFFMDTAAGKETFATIKALSDLQEWSYGYDVVEAETGQFDGQDVQFLRKLSVIEVSPVLQAAGVATRTVAVKSDPPFSEQAERVLGDIESLLNRARAFGSQGERKDGRVLSAANHGRLTTMAETLGTMHQELKGLLAEHDPNKHRTALIREYVRFQRELAHN